MIGQQRELGGPQHGQQRLHAVDGDAVGQLGQHLADRLADAVVVVRVLELTDRREARLLERPDRGTVVRVRVGDACRRRRSGEDDTAHELCDDPRAEAAARLLLFGEEQIHACDTLAGAGERCVLRVVRDEVGLDEPAARSSRSIT